MICDLCKQEFPILTPIDFTDYIWKQGDTFQKISCNAELKNFKIGLCYDCRNIIFASSVPCISFNQDLFLTLKNKIVKKGVLI